MEIRLLPSVFQFVYSVYVRLRSSEQIGNIILQNAEFFLYYNKLCLKLRILSLLLSYTAIVIKVTYLINFIILVFKKYIQETGSEKGLCHSSFCFTAVFSSSPSCHIYTVLTALKSCLSLRIIQWCKQALQNYVFTLLLTEIVDVGERSWQSCSGNLSTAKPLDCQ